MKSSWQLQEAKARFSEMVDRALSDGPQTVTRRGKPTVVVVSIDEFAKSRGNTKSKKSLVKLLRECPAPELSDFLDETREAPDFGRSIVRSVGITTGSVR